MNRRKSKITKRSEYVDMSTDDEINDKIVNLKRKLPKVDQKNVGDDCEWEPINSSPKMMRITRKTPPKLNMEPGDDHDYVEFDEKFDSSKHCTNRNALMARQNRIKKKMYVEKLENTIEELKNSFQALKKRVTQQDELIDKIQKENRYLRNVVTNSAGLKQILQGVRLAGLSNSQDLVNSRPSETCSSTTTSSTYRKSTNLASPENLASIDKVDVTELPSSTTVQDDFGESFSSTSPMSILSSTSSWADKPVAVHDYSSNPQLYYDTVLSRTRSSLAARRDLSI